MSRNFAVDRLMLYCGRISYLVIAPHFFSYSLMYKCWKISPGERPTFEALSLNFMERLQEVSGYLELRMVLESEGSARPGEVEGHSPQ